MAQRHMALCVQQAQTWAIRMTRAYGRKTCNRSGQGVRDLTAVFRWMWFLCMDSVRSVLHTCPLSVGGRAVLQRINPGYLFSCVTTAALDTAERAWLIIPIRHVSHKIFVWILDRKYIW
jgi:hypothetical protein